MQNRHDRSRDDSNRQRERWPQTLQDEVDRSVAIRGNVEVGLCFLYKRACWCCQAVIMQLFNHQPTPLSFSPCCFPVFVLSELPFPLFDFYFYPFIPFTRIFLDHCAFVSLQPVPFTPHLSSCSFFLLHFPALFPSIVLSLHCFCHFFFPPKWKTWPHTHPFNCNWHSILFFLIPQKQNVHLLDVVF